MKKCQILANGQHPSKTVFDFLKDAGYETLICADGGANSAFKLKLKPEYIIGDLDSITDKVKEYYSDKSEIIELSRQTDTDVEKCLKFAIKKGFTDVVLLGATGDRLDHTFCNLGIVFKFFDKIKIIIVHQKTVLAAYTGEVELETVPEETISLYGIDADTKITSAGLKYPLKNSALPFGVKESTSNVAISDRVYLNIKGGKIFVIRKFNTLKKNGFFFGS